MTEKKTDTNTIKHDDLPSTVETKKPDTKPKKKPNTKPKASASKPKAPTPLTDSTNATQGESNQKQQKQSDDSKAADQPTKPDEPKASTNGKPTQAHHTPTSQGLGVKSRDEIFNDVIQIAIPVARTGDYIRRRRGTDVRHMTDKQKRGFNYFFEGMKSSQQTESGHEINNHAKALKRFFELVCDAVEGN